MKESLHRAIERQDLEAVENILRGNVNIDLQNDKGHTFLYNASRLGHADVVKMLEFDHEVMKPLLT